ncbi:MAG: AIM24 family protein [Spirochaetota bacterium]
MNVTIPAGRMLRVEASAMAYIDSSLSMKAQTRGGLKRMLSGETVYLQNSSYLASSPDLDVTAEFQGAKGFFSGEKLFMVRCSGSGTVWIQTRKTPAFVRWADQFRRVEKKNDN